MKNLILAAAVALMLGGCAGNADYDPYVASIDNQLQARGVQTRKIEDTDYTQLVAAIIATLQDYHFRIIDIDPELGTITAYQMTNFDIRNALGGRTELTVLIRERAQNNYSVRMNMSTGLAPAHGSELYQQFFTALHKKLHYQSKA